MAKFHDRVGHQMNYVGDGKSGVGTGIDFVLHSQQQASILGCLSPPTLWEGARLDGVLECVPRRCYPSGLLVYGWHTKFQAFLGNDEINVTGLALE